MNLDGRHPLLGCELYSNQTRTVSHTVSSVHAMPFEVDLTPRTGFLSESSSIPMTRNQYEGFWTPPPDGRLGGGRIVG